jgi:hypothetical protein
MTMAGGLVAGFFSLEALSRPRRLPPSRPPRRAQA